MEDLSRAIDRQLEAQFGGLRRLELAARGAACLTAVGMACALVLGFWQPSAERAAQWLLALVLLWGAVHLLRSVVGAITCPPNSN